MVSILMQVKENEENEENVGDSKRLPAKVLESLVEAENQKAKTRTKKSKYLTI